MSESYGKREKRSERRERESEVCVTFPLTLLLSLSLSPSFVFLDYLFKFLVIGNAGVGKSCLLHQFIEHKCKREREKHIIVHTQVTDQLRFCLFREIGLFE